MRFLIPGISIVVASFLGSMATETAKEADKPATNDSVKAIYDLTVKDMDGKDVALSKYKGDVLLIVNTASK